MVAQTSVVYPDPVILPDMDGHTGLAEADPESDLFPQVSISTKCKAELHFLKFFQKISIYSTGTVQSIENCDTCEADEKDNSMQTGTGVNKSFQQSSDYPKCVKLGVDLVPDPDLDRHQMK